MWIFITNDDVNNENLDLHGPASSILTISTMDIVKTRNFYSSNSNYHRCKIFTSRSMFSKQAKTIQLVRTRLPVSKTPQYPIWPPFLPEMFVIPYQTIWHYIISVFDIKIPWSYIRINDSTISKILKHQRCYELCCFPFWQGSVQCSCTLWH